MGQTLRLLESHDRTRLHRGVFVKAATSQANPRQKQDWFLKSLQGIRAHPLAACGVATLCCRKVERQLELGCAALVQRSSVRRRRLQGEVDDVVIETPPQLPGTSASCGILMWHDFRRRHGATRRLSPAALSPALKCSHPSHPPWSGGVRCLRSSEHSERSKTTKQTH
jgi:hypothetical protein